MNGARQGELASRGLRRLAPVLRLSFHRCRRILLVLFRPQPPHSIARFIPRDLVLPHYYRARKRSDIAAAGLRNYNAEQY